MSDQDRREEAAERELLDTVTATQSSSVSAAVATEASETAARPTPETQGDAAAPAVSMEEGVAETEMTQVQQAQTADVAAEAALADDDDTAPVVAESAPTDTDTAVTVSSDASPTVEATGAVEATTPAADDETGQTTVAEELAQAMSSDEEPAASEALAQAVVNEAATSAESATQEVSANDPVVVTDDELGIDATATPAEATAPMASVDAAIAAVDDDGAATDIISVEATTPVVSADTTIAAADATSAEGSDGDAASDATSTNDDDAGASFTPVEGEDDRPRRLKDLEPGMELEGRVTSIALYGVFVDVGVGRDGLVHISEMSDTRIDSPSDIVQIGDTVHVRIKSIDLDARRISLTMRSQRERSNDRRRKRSEVDRSAIANIKVGDVLEGTITGMAPFGAFADVGVGKDGLIHISELSEGRVEKPEDAVQVGGQYSFKVLEVDPDGNRISLSLRRAMRSQKMQQLEPGQIFDGTVSGLAPFGAFVDIGVGRDGLVHISALSDERVGKVEDVVQVGDKITVKVLEVDQQSKRISLTMRLEDPEPTPESEYGDSPSAPRERDLPGQVVPRTGPGAMARFAGVSSARDDRRDDRRRTRRSSQSQAPANPEFYTTDAVEDEEFKGDATLEDLLTKFGGPSSRRERNRQSDDYDDDETEDGNQNTQQSDAIRRTLQQVGNDE